MRNLNIALIGRNQQQIEEYKNLVIKANTSDTYEINFIIVPHDDDEFIPEFNYLNATAYKQRLSILFYFDDTAKSNDDDMNSLQEFAAKVKDDSVTTRLVGLNLPPNQNISETPPRKPFFSNSSSRQNASEEPEVDEPEVDTATPQASSC